LKKNRETTIIVILSLTLLVCLACGIFKAVTKTANDIAREWCEQTYGIVHTGNTYEYEIHSRSPKRAMSAKEWCEIQENIQPFIDVLTISEMKIRRENGNQNN
jgi:hypothetical protein